MQGGELVSQPSDGEALAAAGGVLNQVALSLPRCRRASATKLTYAVELLVAWEDQVPPPRLAPRLVFLLHLVDELAHQVEDAVASPRLFPQVSTVA